MYPADKTLHLKRRKNILKLLGNEKHVLLDKLGKHIVLKDS